MQNILNANQIAAFYHDEFVWQQVSHFIKMALPAVENGKYVVDIGGGCGYFAAAIKRELNIPTRVLDLDPVSIEIAVKNGIEAFVDNALFPEKKNDENIVCFNLILHHLVGKSDMETIELQKNAIRSWQGTNVKIFVNEYIYESLVGNFSGWLIYQITKNHFLSKLCEFVAKFVPSLRANTFGVGVRFRSNSEWKRIFEECEFVIDQEEKGEKEFVSLPRRLLLIKEIRRDSFFLVAK
jgi:hypothetical protein